MWDKSQVWSQRCQLCQSKRIDITPISRAMEKKQIFIDKGTEVKRNSQYNTKALSGNYDKENLTKIEYCNHIT